MIGTELILYKQLEKLNLPTKTDELPDIRELPADIESSDRPIIEPPDISFIERTSRSALMEQYSLKVSETSATEDVNTPDVSETKLEGLTEEEKAKIKEETGW